MANEESGITIKRGLPRKTNRLGGETSQEILRAARHVLIEAGAEGFTIDRVAKEARVTKGALLYHFNSKRKLLEALTTEYVAHLQAKLDEGKEEARKSIRYRKDADETVAGFIEWYRSFRKESAGYTAYGLALLGLTASNQELRAIVSAWYGNLFNELRSSSCKDALLIVLALEGLFYLRHFQLDATHDEDVEMLLTQLEALLQPH